MLEKVSIFSAGAALLLVSGQVIRLAGAQADVSENIILGRPTDHSISIHALADEGTEVFVEYGNQRGSYSARTGIFEANSDNVADISLEGLQADSRYFYALNYRPPAESEYQVGQENSFHTQRPKGSTFTFGVQGDTHPERFADRTPGATSMYHPDLYARTMEQVASVRPDLYFMLGDDFNISSFLPEHFLGDEAALTQQRVDDIYLDQRRFLGLMANSTALFSVIGNHEEARRNLLGTKLHDAAIYAGRARIRMLPVPAPDDFYSGNPEPVEGVGLLRDYFSFTWGDALFIAINPYWHSPVAINPAGNGEFAIGPSACTRSGRCTDSRMIPSDLEEEWLELTLPAEDRWEKTMGDAQYWWLAETLENSDAKYKFVFAHHVLGTGRGGVERAMQYEWGGHNEAGEWEFDERRPDWEFPVHDLFVKYDVSIFFQAHDHLFAHQELEGIVYQTVANPADETYRGRAKNSYKTGTLLDNSGYLNVTVSPNNVAVDYIRSYLPQDENEERRQGEIFYSYTLE